MRTLQAGLLAGRIHPRFQISKALLHSLWKGLKRITLLSISLVKLTQCNPKVIFTESGSPDWRG